jgi:hypothetical protein
MLTLVTDRLGLREKLCLDLDDGVFKNVLRRFKVLLLHAHVSLLPVDCFLESSHVLHKGLHKLANVRTLLLQLLILPSHLGIHLLKLGGDLVRLLIGIALLLS